VTLVLLPPHVGAHREAQHEGKRHGYGHEQQVGAHHAGRADHGVTVGGTTSSRSRKSFTSTGIARSMESTRSRVKVRGAIPQYGQRGATPQ
jgi:hypothetical protein